MPIVRVTSLDDSRLEPYRNLKDRELAAFGGRFLAEGEHVVRRLLASRYATESVLLSERRAEELSPIVPEAVSVYVLPDALVHQVIGFKFHSGVIACGLRTPPINLDQIVEGKKELTLVACPEIANAENLGSLVRICAAFGVDAMLLGEKCCDPLWRQSIRVSMGTVFSLPIVQSKDLVGDLARLRDKSSVQSFAAVLGDDAEPLRSVTRPPRVVILFGNEAQGLERKYIESAERRVTIPMRLGTDSLNVAVAAGVILYELTEG